ncbi:hypothetical protein GOBAR_AA36519 [Gossypium barbadense]|uniref:Uncharacterized protein n=1 Tax=Gossypium barbadense TaxID=3634 RepID=A0A2P5VZD3_GOSBA|nr:hypothetical protein GOBAR_AA36519 [Gossypium barbadense]
MDDGGGRDWMGMVGDENSGLRRGEKEREKEGVSVRVCVGGDSDGGIKEGCAWLEGRRGGAGLEGIGQGGVLNNEEGRQSGER